jgi:tetratricopeptide (TPR) repeat protein
MKRTTEAITALNKFLDASPTDAEAWSELSDLYVFNGMFPQAIFALEEVLLVTPNAWNVSVGSSIPQRPTLTEYRFMLDLGKFCIWPLQAKPDPTSILQNRCEGLPEVLNCVMITFGATTG